MKESKKKYWKGVEELNPSLEFLEKAKQEFPYDIRKPLIGEETTRRDFLKVLGFGVTAVSLAACEAPVKKAIPYLNKPEEIDPGVPNYYASSYINGGDYCSILVKTREGRPIKIEGNKLSSITQGGTNARVQASVLSLYDEDRLKNPKKAGKDVSWKDVDGEVRSALVTSEKIAIVSNTILSPSTKKVIKDFTNKYSSATHITYDAISNSALLEANLKMFGKYVVPSYDFSKAETIVSFGADFLGTWISDIEFSKQYAKGKKVGNKSMKMNRHYQFESIMSMTGANADYRTAIKPSEQGKAIAALYNAIGGQGISVNGKFDYIENAAKDLLANKGKSIVVVDSEDVQINLLVNKINELLNNYGTTINIEQPSFQRQGNTTLMADFVANVATYSAVIFLDCNPVYNFEKGSELAKGLKSVALTVSTSSYEDETAKLCSIITPNNHYLESWNDAEPKMGKFSLAQPAISQIFDTRQSATSLMIWSGQGTDYSEKIKSNWNEYIMPLANEISFDLFWNKSLHDGVYETNTSYTSIHAVANTDALGEISLTEINSSIEKIKSSPIEFIAYQKVAIADGSQLNNPWLHECPDPVTKACWGDYVSMSRKTAFDNNLTQDDLVTLFEGNNEIKLPVLIQPGQVDNTIAIAYGYGMKGGKCIDLLNGVNIFGIKNPKIKIASTGEQYKIAQTQTHHTYFGRESVIQESTLDKYKDLDGFVKSKFTPMVTGGDGVKQKPANFDMYDKHDYNNHHWGMMVDMNSCTGCSACVVACVAENNIPVVGRQEVINRRDMHWMRIDRYYSMNNEFFDNNEKSFGMDDVQESIMAASSNPEVVFQPMMCQHCNHASCENVCPVAATTHSSEGLNQMAYNRCIGTRYCANNCAYKVRRFNWFNYADNDSAATERGFSDTNPVLSDLGRMVLNPDVVVRFRGVMEKCSMCVQRIQYGKLEAKKEGRRPTDNDIQTACQQACPSDAIVFGDMNNPESQIAVALNGEQKERSYNVLEELNTQPNIHYLTKIRNKA